MKSKIAIINAGIGNISSVANAFSKLGIESEICSSPEQLENSGKIVIPGVGAFGDGISLLETKGFLEQILRKAEKGDFILGICLGMQLLLDKSYEFGEFKGMGLIPGEVKRIEPENEPLRLPHIGWNDTSFVKEDPLFAGLDSPVCYYYVNSYYCHCSEDRYVLGTFEYGKDYSAVIRNDNIYGVQFHPEKSQKYGLKLLSNFMDMK